MDPTTALPVPPIPKGLGFSPEHELARAEVRRFLAERCPITEIRRLSEDARGFDPAVWRDIGKLGWIGLGVPESLGGSGLDSLHVALLFEEMGRALLPSPFFGSWLALETLRAAGSKAQTDGLCPALALGERVASLAFVRPGAQDRKEATAEPAGGEWKLSGTLAHVMFAEALDLLLVPARESSGVLSLFAVDLPSPNVRVEAESALDGTRRTSRVTLDGVRVPASAKLEGDGQKALGEVTLRATAMLACEMVGGAEHVLGLTRSYAISRIQFGKPIGAFQAVKHPIVDMMVGIELARNLSLSAAVAMDVAPDRAEPLARAAKAMASDVYVAASKKGVQLHGGYGFTWDCDVHFWFKRALVSRSWLGDACEHRAWIAAQLFTAQSA